MREILFRGKTYDGEWENGSLLIQWGEMTNDGEREREYLILGMKGENQFVVPETVGQYTGLQDKNGEKIFEGDIIEHHAQGNIIVNRGVVNWDSKNARWAHQLNTMNPDFTFYNPNAFEVIGNICDNPELLEVDT